MKPPTLRPRLKRIGIAGWFICNCLVAIFLCVLQPSPAAAQYEVDEPVADISTDVDISNGVTAPVTITFDFTASVGSRGSNIVRYMFDPGDGVMREYPGLASIKYEYTGEIEVRLQVFDENGLNGLRYRKFHVTFDAMSNSLPDYFSEAADEYAWFPSVVDKNPQAILSSDVTTGPAPLRVKFNFRDSFSYVGNPLEYYFYDGSEGSKKPEEITQKNRILDGFHVMSYDKPGRYTCMLLVQEMVPQKAGSVLYKTDVAQLVIKVTDPADGGSARSELPIASIVPSSKEGMAPFTVDFNFTGSEAQDGSRITEYYFDYGNGEFVPCDAVASHTYNHAGSYIARVNVWDSAGLHAQMPVVIRVLPRPMNLPPVARISPSTTTGPAPLEVIFDFTQSEAIYPASELHYEFSDGNSPFEDSPPAKQHTFQQPGTYTVKLRVRDENGQASFASQTIIVQEPVQTNDAGSGDEALDNPLKAVLGASTTKGIAPLHIDFNFGGSQGDIQTYEFDDGVNGVVYDTQTASTVYAEPGTYTAMLRVWDTEEGYDTQTLSIVVEAPGDSSGRDADPMGLGDRTVDPEDEDPLERILFGDETDTGSLWDDPDETDTGVDWGDPVDPAADKPETTAARNWDMPIDPSRDSVPDGSFNGAESPVVMASYWAAERSDGAYDVHLNLSKSYSPAGIPFVSAYLKDDESSGQLNIPIASLADFVYICNAAGQHTVTVNIQDVERNIGEYKLQIDLNPSTILPAPMPDLSWVEEANYAGGHMVTFSLNGSYSPGGTPIDQYFINFNDGSGWISLDSWNPNYVRDFDNPGFYQVGVYLIDVYGISAEQWFNVEISPETADTMGGNSLVPRVGYSQYTENGQNYVRLDFTGSYSNYGSTILYYAYNLNNDQGWLEPADPSHVVFSITQSGTYNVGLNIMDEAGGMAEQWFALDLQLESEPVPAQDTPAASQSGSGESPSAGSQKVQVGLVLFGWLIAEQKQDPAITGQLRLYAQTEPRFDRVEFSLGDQWYEGSLDKYGNTWLGPTGTYAAFAGKHAWCRAYRNGKVYELDYDISEIDDAQEHGIATWYVD